MSRISDFETKLDELINDFADVSYGELAESLEYYSASLRNKQNR
jgi:hypothetical protein